ncbi:MAG: DUF3617 family protein [Sphingomonadaceae bacterium]|nr:DUF3617 family protein [Sphingomonadaceae bacterium]
MQKLLFVAPIALLAACSGASETDGVEAGQWEFTVTATGVDAPNAPDAAQQAMNDQLQAQPAQTTSECFSDAEADNFAANLNRFSGNENCEITNSEVGDGNILVEGSCNVPGTPEPSALVMRGTYDRTSVQATVNLDMTAPPLGDVTIEAELQGEHQGDC